MVKMNIKLGYNLENTNTSLDTKSAKKNKKRKTKKPGESNKNETKDLDPREMLAVLREKLEEAKVEKDHEGAQKIREQIWVLNDMNAGIRTNIPKEDLERIIQSIHTFFHPPKPEEEKLPVTVKVVPVTSDIHEDKHMRNIQKKLEQIKQLKERQKKGEKLEANQLEKIKTEQKILDEIKELEDLLTKANLTH